jgi:hypothetical protein
MGTERRANGEAEKRSRQTRREVPCWRGQSGRRGNLKANFRLISPPSSSTGCENNKVALSATRRSGKHGKSRDNEGSLPDWFCQIAGWRTPGPALPRRSALSRWEMRETGTILPQLLEALQESSSWVLLYSRIRPVGDVTACLRLPVAVAMYRAGKRTARGRTSGPEFYRQWVSTVALSASLHFSQLEGCRCAGVAVARGPPTGSPGAGPEPGDNYWIFEVSER